MKALSTVNRILLGLVGAVLLGGGLLVLAAGLDVYRHWNLAPPHGWPLVTPRDVLLSASDRLRWSNQGWWWWPAVIAALVIVLLLALRWLLAQFHRQSPGRLPVGGKPPEDGVELRDDALSDAITAETLTLPGVRQASTRLAGRPTHPRARIALTLDPDSDPGEVVERLYQEPLAHGRRSAGWEHLPVRARLRVARHSPRRAE
jgi:hypothetical protein